MTKIFKTLLLTLCFVVSFCNLSGADEPFASFMVDGVFFKGYASENEVLLCFSTKIDDNLNGDFGITLSSNFKDKWIQNLPLTIYKNNDYFIQPVGIKLTRKKMQNDILIAEVGICKSLGGGCLPVYLKIPIKKNINIFSSNLECSN